MDLIVKHDETVAKWAESRLRAKFNPPRIAMGIVDGSGVLVGAAIWNAYQEKGNVELSYVGPGTLSRTVMRKLAKFAFGDLGASRVTLKTSRKNDVTKKLLGNKRHGFVYEMTQKRYFGPSPVTMLWCSASFQSRPRNG